MDILNEALESVAVADLKLHPWNVNEGDIGAIHQSIEHNGFYGAVVAQRSTGYVLAGNHRLQAAQAAGAESVPVIWVDVDDEHALRILLADNRTTRLGHDDPAALADLLNEILDSAGTLDGTGYTGDDLDELLADLGADDLMDVSDGDGTVEEATVLRFEDYRVPLTERESNALAARLKAHSEDTGSYYGFVAALLDLGTD